MIAFQKLCTFLDLSALGFDKFPREHCKHERAGLGQAGEGVLWGHLKLGSGLKDVLCGGPGTSLHHRVAATF